MTVSLKQNKYYITEYKMSINSSVTEGWLAARNQNRGGYVALIVLCICASKSGSFQKIITVTVRGKSLNAPAVTWVSQTTLR